MGGRSSRVKGHRFERELAITFRELYGESVKRGFQSRNGAESPDVDGLPFWVEAKRGKKTYPMAALAQAEEACADDGRPPVAVCRNDQDTDAVVVLRLSTFLDILKRPEVYCANQSQDSDR